MRKTIKTQSWLFASLALICLATGAMADSTVTMQLIGPPPGPILGGVYTSPYTALIGPAGQTLGQGQTQINGVSTLVVCDDFQTNMSTVTPPWQAIDTNLNSILGEATTSGVVKFDNSATVAQQQFDYQVAAYLALEILNTDQSTTAGQVTAGQLSFAMWAVFDPPPDSTGPFSGQFVTGSDLAQAQADLSAAQAAVNAPGFTLGGYNVDIFTSNPLGAAQEFITVSAPEAATPILLAADVLGLLFFVGFLRKRTARKA
jgi:hypothetical protein